MAHKMISLHQEQKRGLSIGVFTFVFWGMAPVFFKLLGSVPALVIIAHRIIWGLLFIAVFLYLREGRQFFSVLKITPRQGLILAFSGLLVATNWLVFVWAVNHDHIMATSLGYFINPLINIFLGMLFFADKLKPLQWFALVIAATSTIYLGIYIGEPPWIALMLGFSFGFYGLIRKLLGVRPLIGLFWETALLTIPAVIYLLFISADYIFTGSSLMQYGLLFLSGLVTVIPLIGFNVAAKKLSLTVIGFLQYIAPTLSFLIAVLFYGEVFTIGHQIAFSGIWLALALSSIAPLFDKREQSR